MPGDIFCCSFPHLIALPCQTRAERAKAPSPVPRSISWQSFESNCDCSDLRASESNCVPTVPARTCPVLLSTAPFCSTLLASPSTCPAPAWPWLSLLSLFLSSHRPRLETSLYSLHVRTTPSPPPVSSLQFPVSGLLLPWSTRSTHSFLLVFDLHPTCDC